MSRHWTLRYPGTELQMGQPGDGVLLMSAPAPGDPERNGSDSQAPRADGETHGVDHLGGQTWDLNLGVIAPNEQAALARTAQLQTAWRADAVRLTPGAVAELQSHTGRSLFGRPRRLVPNGEYLSQGYLPVTADFRANGTLWYGPEQEVSVTLIPARGGGFIAPFRFPLTTVGSSARASLFTVGGDTATDHVLLDVEGGEILNPVLQITNLWRQEIAVQVPFDGHLQVERRPWATSTMLGAASVAGLRTRQSSRLTDLRIPPGTHELVLRGQSSGNPRLRLRWRDAFTNY